MFAFVAAEFIVAILVRLALGTWPDDVMLVLPHMTIASGVCGGAAATAITCAPVTLLSKWLRVRRPWIELATLAALSALGARAMLLVWPGSDVLSYVPFYVQAAAAFAALGGGLTALLYWLLAGRPSAAPRR